MEPIGASYLPSYFRCCTNSPSLKSFLEPGQIWQGQDGNALLQQSLTFSVAGLAANAPGRHFTVMNTSSFIGKTSSDVLALSGHLANGLQDLDLQRRHRRNRLTTRYGVLGRGTRCFGTRSIAAACLRHRAVTPQMRDIESRRAGHAPNDSISTQWAGDQSGGLLPLKLGGRGKPGFKAMVMRAA